MNLPLEPKGPGRVIADQTETERLLRSQSLVMQEMRDAVVIFDPQGVILDMNPAAEVVLAWSRKEVLGRNVADLYKMAKVSGLDRNEIAESIQERGYWQGEYSFVRRDGVEVMAEATSYPIPDEATGKLSRVTIIRDITERKAAEESLEESQNRLHEANRIGRVGHWELDTQNWRVRMYGELYLELGAEAEETEAAHDASFDSLHEDDKERVRISYERSVAEGIRFDETYRIYLPDNGICHVRAIGEVFRDRDGKIVGLRGTIHDVSEQKQADEAMRDSEQRVRAILQNVADSVVTIDEAGVILSANQAFAKTFGYPVGEIVGKNVTIIMPEPYRSGHAGYVSQYFESGVSQILGNAPRELEAVDKDGRVFPIELMIGEAMIGDQRVFIGSMRDISDRKETDEKLHESEERNRSIVAALSEGVIFQNARGEIIDWNSQTLEILGVNEDQLRGLASEDYVRKAIKEDGVTEFPGEDYPSMVTLRTGEPCVDVMIGIHHPERGLRWLEVNSEPLFEKGAVKPFGVVSSFTDITERKEAEEAMSRSEASLENAQRIANLGSWERDLATGASFWSDQLYRILDLEPGTPVDSGRLIYHYIHPDDVENVRQAVGILTDTGEPMNVEYRIRSALGHEKTVKGYGEMTYSDSGNRVAIGGTIQDITALRLTEQQLRQAQKMEAVGQLTGGIAHDFNNLLAVISGNLELVQGELPADSDHRQMLEAAFGASQRGADLTGRLLAFSRRQTLMPQPTDIGELTEHVLGLARRTLGEAVEVVFEPAEGAWWANVDPAQLENALLNLAINARDAMPDGGTVTIRTENVSTRGKKLSASDGLLTGEYVLIEVTDTGTGMSEDVREKVFEPFFTTKETGEGTGLGLSMVYGFVKQSGGHVDIESTEGEGTTVHLYLLRSNQISQDVPEVRAASLEVRSSGETVLIVEDDPDVRELAVSLVKSLGYIVLEAGEASSALEIMENGTQVDLLLSDIILGKGMNGVELANQVRESWPDTKVLLMSGYAREAFTREDGLGDTYELIGKPFKMADLAQHIEGLLH